MLRWFGADLIFVENKATRVVPIANNLKLMVAAEQSADGDGKKHKLTQPRMVLKMGDLPSCFRVTHSLFYW